MSAERVATIAAVLAEHEPVLGRFGASIGVFGCSCLSARDYRAAGHQAGQAGWRAHVAAALDAALSDERGEADTTTAAVEALADKWAAERDLISPTINTSIAHDHARQLRAALSGPVGALAKHEAESETDSLAGAWDAGYEAGHQDARSVQATYPESTRNPYRIEGGAR